ncbi:nuclease [Sphingobium sp. TKS]|nr:nuclease [Sphingobium sp. TKS]
MSGVGRKTGHAVLVVSIWTCMLGVALASAEPSAKGRIAYVIDGDTFRMESGERIRIAGVDAAESQAGNAKCRRELTIGNDAKRRATALLEGRIVELARVGRSYNRTVANVRLEGRDVSAILVDAGVARWWPRGKPKPDWCGGTSSARHEADR